MTVETWSVVVAALTLAAGVIAWLIPKFAHLVVRFDRQDMLLFGDPDDLRTHPGLERWQREQTARSDDMCRRMMRVEAELFPNHGGSLRDAVDRIEQTLIPKQRGGQ